MNRFFSRRDPGGKGLGARYAVAIGLAAVLFATLLVQLANLQLRDGAAYAAHINELLAGLHKEEEG